MIADACAVVADVDVAQGSKASWLKGQKRKGTFVSRCKGILGSRLEGNFDQGSKGPRHFGYRFRSIFGSRAKGSKSSWLKTQRYFSSKAS